MSASLDVATWLEGRLAWSELAARLQLPAPGALPLPVPSPAQEVSFRASVKAALAPDQRDAPSDPPEFRFELEFQIEYPVQEFQNWGLTFGRTCRLVLATTLTASELDDARTRFESSDPDPSVRLALDLSADVFIRFPALPSLEFLRVRTGGVGGWVRVRLGFHTEIDNGEPSLRVSVSAADVISADVSVPSLNVPVGSLWIDSIGGDVTIRAGVVAGTLTGAGRVSLRPGFRGLDLPMAEFLGPLLDDVAPHEMAATLTIGVAAGTEDPQVTLDCALEGAGPSIDLVGTFAALTRGGAAPSGAVAAGSAGDHPAGTFGFEIAGFYARLSRFPEFALRTRAHLGPIAPEGYLKLTTTDLEIGLGRARPGEGAAALSIPLRVPHVSRSHFGFRQQDGRSAADDHRDGTTHPVDQAIWDKLSPDGQARYDVSVEAFLAAMELVTGASPKGLGLIEGYQDPSGTWHVRERGSPPAPLRDPIAIRPAVGTVMRRLDDGREEDTGDLLFAVEIDGTWHVLAASPALELDNFALKLSLRNPRNISVSGTARFVVDGPLWPIRFLAVTVGISPDLIYFAAENLGGRPLELPELVPGYGGGKLIFGRLAIGIGYTKRSCAVAFDGGIVLPEQFVNDLDTSDVVGAGIRIPVQSRLAFQLDVIPIVAGDVVIPFPIFMFNVDFRQDVSPGLRDARLCEPFWDGLQLIVTDVMRVSFKKLSYNPMLGLGCMSNSEFDGDLVLGDATTGLSVVADNIFWAYGPDSFYALSIYPVASIPFLDNFCVSLRLGGFALHFHLERPTPSFSPFAIFELMALLADPVHYPVAPRGDLANMVRASVNDAYVILPEPVRHLFPQLDAVARRPVNVTINLATFIALVQAFAQGLESAATVAAAAVREALGAGQRAGTAGRRLLEAAQSLEPDDIAALVGQLLRAVPADLRKLRADASFGGFDASAVIVLMDDAEARAQFAARSAWSNRPRALQTLTWDMLGDQAAAVMRGFRPQLGERLADAADPTNSPLRGREFDDFTAADLDGIGPPASKSPGAGVLVAARVRVFAGRRIRFLGRVFEDGSFSFVSALKVEPLELTVSGIRLPLPLQPTVRARVRLSGRARRHGVRASIQVQGTAGWTVIPGVLRLEIGNEKEPADLTLHSDGRFGFVAGARVTLFDNDKCHMPEARIDVNELRCIVEGELNVELGTVADRAVFALHAGARGQVGPGETFRLELRARKTPSAFCGFPLRSFTGALTQSGGEITMAIEQPEHVALDVWPGSASFAPKCRITRAELTGWFNAADTEVPDFGVEGALGLQLFDDAGPRIDGRGRVESKAGSLRAAVEGTLRWQGREWLQGRIELGDDKCVVAGHVACAFTLPKLEFGSGDSSISVASLFVSLRLDGTLTLDAEGRLTEHTIGVECFIAARLADDSQQVLPLVSHRMKSSGPDALKIPLVASQSFSPLPAMPSMSVPVPAISRGALDVLFGWGTVTIGLADFRGPVILYGDHHIPVDPRSRESDWQPTVTLQTIDVPRHPSGALVMNNVAVNVEPPSALPAFSANLEWAGTRLELVIAAGSHEARFTLEGTRVV